MKTKLLIGLAIIAMTLILVSTATAGMQPGALTVPTWTPPPPDESEQCPDGWVSVSIGCFEITPQAPPDPYPAPELELIMKSEQWIEVDGLIQIFPAP